MLRKVGVFLTKEQETALLEMVTKGTAGARPIRRAHSLLLSWEGQTDAQIATVLRCHEYTVAEVRRRFAERGMASLYDKPRPGQKRRLDGEGEATLVALACSNRVRPESCVTGHRGGQRGRRSSKRMAS